MFGAAIILIMIFAAAPPISAFNVLSSQNQANPTQNSPAPLPPAPQAPPPSENQLQIPQVSPPTPNPALSRKATDYLRTRRLPFVTAQVFSDAAGRATSIVLSGQVATAFGKQDAAAKARKFVGNAELAIQNQIQVVPSLASRAPMPANQGGELELPTIFQGCWQLVRDTQAGPVELVPGGANVGCEYTQDSGGFCYKRDAAGKFEPTFSSLRINPGLYGNMGDQWSRLEVLSTDGVSTARMRFLLHHGGSAGPVIPFFGALGGGGVIDETHDFTCRVDGNRMQCTDHENGRFDGEPWCEADHLDEFVRTEN